MIHENGPVSAPLWQYEIMFKSMRNGISITQNQTMTLWTSVLSTMQILRRSDEVQCDARPPVSSGFLSE